MSRPVTDSAPDLAQRFTRTREASERISRPLSPEDTVVQTMPEVSPTKWHLAHTSWFFEEFVLQRLPGFRFFAEDWRFLFNSYYQSVGPMHARFARGLLSRPGLAEVIDYRRAVTEAVVELLQGTPDAESLRRIELGIHHEQQHQELMLTDIKHVLSCHPLEPAYRGDLALEPAADIAQSFQCGVEGIASIGADPGEGFVFDCETPRHSALLHPHALARRPVNNGEYREFVQDGGYRCADHWLSEGWATVNADGWTGPLYWDADAQSEFTLAGRRDLDPLAPVCHVSYFEADAFARWAGRRLPLESEWERAAQALDPLDGHFADRDLLHPQGPTGEAAESDRLLQMFGDVWEWTASPFVSYPGFKPLPGALGEYNGKFMCGQWVLRGGSCVTPSHHVRATYRNFFQAKDRWQFSGIRLATD